MAEDNINIEIKTPQKSINSTREAFMAENEKNILGPRGFKFSLDNNFKKKINIYDVVKKIDLKHKTKLNINSKILPKINLKKYNNNENDSKLMKSRSLVNIYNNNLKCLTNRVNNNNISPKWPKLSIKRNKDNSINSLIDDNKIFSSLSSPNVLNNLTNINTTKKEEISSLKQLSILRKHIFFSKINNNIEGINMNKSNNNLIKNKSLKKVRRFNGLNRKK